MRNGTTSRPSTPHSSRNDPAAMPTQVHVKNGQARGHLSPRGRGREVMTCGRVLDAAYEADREDAVVSHLAELVRGDLLISPKQGPLIRPSATFSLRGEGHTEGSLEAYTRSRTRIHATRAAGSVARQHAMRR